MYTVRGRRGASRRRALSVLAVLITLALNVRLPLTALIEAHFPNHTPEQLAHFLSDFTNYPGLNSHIGPWSIVNDWSNYSSWQYTVAYECGPRCAGSATVSAHDDRDTSLRHGHHDAHRLIFHDKRCTRLPFLPWPQYCEETEVVSHIVKSSADGEGRGARLVETTQEWCGAVRAAMLRCTPQRYRSLHLQALQFALQST